MFVVEIINWIWFILFVCIRKRYWEMIGNHSAFATVEHTFLMQNLNQLDFFSVLHRFHSIYVLVLTHNNWRWTNKQRQSVRIYCDEASIRLCAGRFYVWHVIVIRRFDDSAWCSDENTCALGEFAQPTDEWMPNGRAYGRQIAVAG